MGYRGETGDDPDYYALLEVAPDADEVAIRLAYRRLARRYHPDVVGTGSAALMKALNAAYAVLGDAEQRLLYDARRGYPMPGGAGPFAPPASPSPAAPPRPAAAPRPAPPPRSTQPRHGTLRQSGGPLRLVAALAAPDASPVVSLAFARGGLLVGLGLIDGRVLLHDLQAGRVLRTLAYGVDPVAGVLQELRLSPAGVYAVAWGFLLGTRVWRTADGATLWQTAMNGPSGTLDIAVVDAPPLARLAAPDAPLALAGDDPFRWSEEGRQGTAVYARPLTPVVDPSWAVPLRCDETRAGGFLREPADERWRVRYRLLSSDGRRLLTLSTGGAVRGKPGLALTWWDLDARTGRGGAEGKRIARLPIAYGELTFPFAATPDLAWVAGSDFPVGLRLLAQGGRESRAVPAGAVRPEARVALSPDGGHVAVGREDRVEVWETHGGQRTQEWQFGAEVTALAFCAAGARPLLGVGLANGLAELWGA